MTYYEILSYLATILGVIIAVVYWKTNYSYFFSFQALSDLASFVLWTFFSLSSQTLWIPIHYLIASSVDKKFFVSNWKYILVGLVAVLIFNFFTTNVIQQYSVLATSFIVLFVFLRWFVMYYFNSDRINIFFLILIFHETIKVIKFLAILNDIDVGLNIYFAGVLIQIIVGVILVIIKNKVSLGPPRKL